LALLCELNVPGLVALACIPHGLTAKDVLPLLMDAGWQLLIAIAFVTEISEKGALSLGDPVLAGIETWMVHSLVPYGYDDDGLDVIVGWHDLPVTKIKWNTMPALCWTNDQQMGISREFVMVLPHNRSN
jgi:hypothetical protein